MSVRRRLQDNRGEPDIVTPLLPMASPVGLILNSITRVIGGAQEVSEHVRDTRDDGKRKSFSPLFVSRFVFANQISPDRPQ